MNDRDVSLPSARDLDLAVGGQAVIEGVMMRSPTAVATAVRVPDGRIVVQKRPFRSFLVRWKLHKVPVLRGGLHLLESLGIGIGALMYSAEQASVEERVESVARRPLDTVMMWGTLLVAFAVSMGVFFYFPLLVADWLGVEHRIWFNVTEGVIRIALFIGYLLLIERLPDMARVFQYHGAEHMSIHAFENGRPLTPAGARPFPTLHPRCGTSFLFFVMLIALVVFSFLGRPETVAQRLQRLLWIPVIGGLAYEAIKLSGRYPRAWWIRPLIWPGLMLQKITTSVPDDDQLAVGLAALKAVLTPAEPGSPVRTWYEPEEPAAEPAPAAAAGATATPEATS